MLHSDALGAELGVIAYGHYGRPVLAFPAERGHCWDYENQGMVAAIADLIDGGRVKLYCVDTIDGQTWQDGSLPLEERARRHGLYEDWIINHVAPFIHADCGGAQEIIVNGPSFGAYHAANFALKRADLFPLAICQSGIYDVSVVGWGERGDAVYFSNPADYVAQLAGRPPGLAAQQREPARRLRTGPVGGHDRRAGELQALRRPAGREGPAPRAGPLGPRRAARLAVLARAARAPPAALLLTTPNGAPATAQAGSRA